MRSSGVASALSCKAIRSASALFLVALAVSYAAVGCGGSFTGGTSASPGTNPLAGHSYLVQVIASDGASPTPNKYYAIVPLTLNGSSK